MKLDIRTLAIVLCLTNVLQVVALSVLYRVNMYHQGLGWWILGNATLAVGFVFNSLRDSTTIGPIAIVANSSLFVGGLALIYTGIMRFLGQRERPVRLVVFCALVTLIAWYFTCIDDNLAARRINVSLGIAVMSFLIARSIHAHKIRAVASTSYFLHIVFLVCGVFFAVRGLSPIFTGSTGEMFTATITQTMTYMVVLIVSTLWTLGFIIMISQRLAEENREARNAAETALENEHQMLLEQRQFLSMVSHEFRTPLAVADFAAANLTEVPPIDQDDIDRRVAQIRRATKSMTHLIDNCMTSERIEHGGFVVVREETKIFPLIMETAQLVCFSPKHTFQIEYDESDAVWSLDPTLVRIALSNLIDNAVKYSNCGVVTVNVQRQDDGLHISVSNKGVGVQNSDKEKLFRKFVRGSAANQGKSIRGSGLGLYISKRIAQAHGGDVFFVPNSEGTTVFELWLPEST